MLLFWARVIQAEYPRHAVVRVLHLLIRYKIVTRLYSTSGLPRRTRKRMSDGEGGFNWSMQHLLSCLKRRGSEVATQDIVLNSELDRRQGNA